MRIVFRGNFQRDLPPDVPPWSTESHLAASLELLGHEVVRNHEQTDDWAFTLRQAENADLFVWTSTWDYATAWPKAEAFRSIRYLSDRTPTVAVHLDVFWRLTREWQIRENAMFRCRWVFTADGDSDHLWEKEGIDHHWMPPGIFEPDAVDGTPRDEFRSDVAFVGSWQRYAHPEHWPQRRAMLERLTDRYRRGDRVRFWPRDGEPAVRGQALNDLYASVKVAVGDSCVTHPGARNYWSDRVPETIGRGAFLVHPAIPGLVEMLPEGMGVAYFPPGDLDAMVDTVDWWLAHDDEREEARRKGQAFVREHHSYTARMRQVLETVEAAGAWR